MTRRKPLLEEMGTEMMKLLRAGEVMIYPDMLLTHRFQPSRRVESTPLWECYRRWADDPPADPDFADLRFVGLLLKTISRLNTQRRVRVLLDPDDERVLVFPLQATT